MATYTGVQFFLGRGVFKIGVVDDRRCLQLLRRQRC